MKVTAESAIKEYKRIEAELFAQKFTVEDAKRMFEKLSEAFADKSVGDMWSMGFLTTMRVTDILDLLNSQKAEIERLNVELVGMRGACESYKMHYDNACAEVEELQTKNKKYKAILEAINDEINPLPFETDFDKAINKAKSEAIKVFAERYEKEVLSLLTSATLDKKDGIYACLNILTEMVGDSND